MFEGLVADALARVLGEYVKGLDKDKIKLGVWNGKLELKSLALHSEALAILFETLGVNLPVTVLAGQIGTLRVEVPWKSLRSQAIKIKLSELSIVASPAKVAGDEALALRQRRIKLGKLSADEVVRESRWSERTVTSSSGGRYSRLFGGVTSRLLSRVVDNIQIELSDIHLRFEDQISDPKKPMCIEMELAALRLLSSDQEWKVVYVEGTGSGLVHKLIQLDGLVVRYTNLQEAYNSNVHSSLRQQILYLSQQDNPVELISPINGEVHATISRSVQSKQDAEIVPEVQLDVFLPGMNLSLDEFQYSSLLNLSNELATFKKKGGSNRPQNAKGRWLWTLEQLLPGFVERHKQSLLWSDQGIQQWSRRTVSYVSSRLAVVKARREGAEGKAEQDQIITIELEDEMSTMETIGLRDAVDGILEEEFESAKKAAAGNTTTVVSSARTRFASLFSRTATKQADTSKEAEVDTPVSSVELTDEADVQKELEYAREIVNDFGGEDLRKEEAEEEEDGENVITDVPKLKLGVLLEKGSVTLVKGGHGEHPRNPLAVLDLLQVQIGVLTRPSNGTILVEVLLSSISLKSLKDNTNLLYPRMVRNPSGTRANKSGYPENVSKALTALRTESQEDSNEACEHLLAMRIVKFSPSSTARNPSAKGEEADLKVEVSVSGVEAVVDGPLGTLIDCGKFWKSKNQNLDAIMSVLGEAAKERLKVLRQQLQKAMQAKQIPVYIDISVRGPRVLIPSRGEEDIVLMVDLGKLTFGTVGRCLRGSEALPYTEYVAAMSDLSAVMLHSEKSASRREKILEPVSIRSSVQVVEEDDSTLHIVNTSGAARVRALGVLPGIQVNVSQDTYRLMLKLMKSWKKEMSLAQEAADSANVESGDVQSQAETADTTEIGPEDTATMVADPNNSLNDIDIRFTLQDVAVAISDGQKKRMMSIGAHGSQIRLVKSSRELNADFRLQKFEATDYYCSSEPRRFIFSGAEEQDSAAERKTFVQVKYRKDEMLVEHDVKVKIRTLDCTLISEVVTELVRFLYNTKDGETEKTAIEEVEDPFAAAGTSATEAAKLLKTKADAVIQRSRAAIAKLGRLKLQSEFDGLKLLVTSNPTRDITLFVVKDLFLSVDRSPLGDISSDGRFGSITIKNLRTEFEEQRIFLDYTGGRHKKGSTGQTFGFSAQYPQPGNGDPSISARFKSLRLIFVQQFIFDLQCYFKRLTADCKEIISKTTTVESEESALSEAVQMEPSPRLEAPRKARLKVTTESIDITFPRHSKNNHEAVKAHINAISVNNNDPPSVGYNFAFNLSLDGLSVFALYPKGEEKFSFVRTSQMAHISPIIDNLCIRAKMDYWREGDKYEVFDGAVAKERPIISTNPHHRLPAIRIRTAPVDGIQLRLCEAQYAIMYFVFTENFIEPQAPSWEELMAVANKNLAEEVEAPSNVLPPALKLILNSSRVGIQLVADDDPEDVEKQLFDITATELNFNLDAGTDARIFFDLKAKLDGLFDRRPNQQFTTLASSNSISTPAMVNVSFDRPFLRRANVAVVVSDLRLVIAPDFFAQLAALALPGDPVVPTSLPGFDIPFCGRTVVVTLVRIEVLLFCEAFENDPRTAVLRGDVFIDVKKKAFTRETSLNIGSKGITLSLTEAEIADGGRTRTLQNFETPLIFPCELLLELAASGSKPEDGRLLHLSSSEEVTLRLAVQDVKIVVDAVMRCLNVKAPPRKEGRPEVAKVEQPQGALTFILSLSTIRILLTDEPDDLYIPVMDVRMSRATLCSMAPAILKVGGGLSAALYDRERGWWVPGIEPLPVELAISTGAESKSIMLHCSERLDVNATPVTIEGAMTVSRAIQRAIQSVGAESDNSTADKRERIRRPEASAFVVRNESGMEVTIWTSTSSKRLTLGGAGEERAIEMATDNLVNAEESASKKEDKLAIYLSPAGFRAKLLKLSDLTTQKVEFSPRGLELIWEVRMRGGIPIGIIRTTHRLINHTSLGVEVKCGSLSLYVGPNGGYQSLPVSAIEQQIFLRPAEEGNLPAFECSVPLWRREQFLGAAQKKQSLNRTLQQQGRAGTALDTVNEHESFLSPSQPWTLVKSGTAMRDWNSRPGVAWQTLTCAPSSRHVTTSPLCFALEGAGRNEEKELDIHIHPPLLFENALPRNLRIRLYRRRGTMASLVLYHELEPLSSVQAFAPGCLSEFWMEISYSNEPQGPGAEAENEAKFAKGFWLGEVGAREIPISINAGGLLNTQSVKVELARRDSTLRACFYADLWLRNRSDVNLQVKCWGTENTESGVLEMSACPPGMPANPFLCSLGPYLSFRADKNGRWSPLGVPATDLSRAVELEGLGDKNLLLKVKAARGGFQRSAIATVRVALWLENLTGQGMEWCHSSALDKRGIIVSSSVNNIRQGEVSPVHYKKWGSGASIRFRLLEKDGSSDWIWSSTVDVERAKSIAAKMYNPKIEEQYIARTRVVPLRGGSRKIVVYSEDRDHPPYRMVNECRFRSVAFAQASSENLLWLIAPGTTSRYSWDKPLVSPSKRFLKVSVIENVGTLQEYSRSESFDIGIDEVGTLSHFFESNGGQALHIRISLDGPTKVVTFADSAEPLLALKAPDATEESPSTPASVATPITTMGWDEFDNIHKDPTEHLSALNKNSLDETASPDMAEHEEEETLSPSGVSVEAEAPEQEDTPATPELVLDVEILFSSIGISVIDDQPEELIYILLRNARLHIEKFEGQRGYEVEVEDLQIDNQLPAPRWPVLLWSPAPKDSTQSPAEEAHVRDTRRKFLEMKLLFGPPVRGITMIKAVYVAIQQIQLSVDEELVMRIWLLAQSFMDPSVRAEQEPLGADDGEGKMLYAHAGEDNLLLQCLYAENLILAPIKLTLNMASSRTPLPRRPGQYWGLIRTLIATFGNVENAEFRLNALQLKHVFDTKDDLMNLILEFYARQLNKQKLFTFVTSNNLIGNPSVLFDHISTGAKDFFVEPYKVKSGAEFLPELYKGSTSLIGNTVGGIVGAVGSIPKALAGTMESAILDRQYAAERSAIHGGGNYGSRSLGQGLAVGAMSLGHGISAGFTGLFLDPYRGAIADGTAGFFKGLGKGVVGGVLKPLTGALDMLAEPTIGFRTAIVKMSRDVATPSRPPRAFLRSGENNRKLITYDFERSLGNDIFATLKRKKMVSDSVDDLVGWVMLLNQPAHGLAGVWQVISAQKKLSFSGGRSKNSSSSKINHKIGRIALVTNRNVYIANSQLSVFWKCPVAEITSVEGSAEDETVLIVARKIERFGTTRWSKINCFSQRNRDDFYELLMQVISTEEPRDMSIEAAERRKSAMDVKTDFDNASAMAKSELSKYKSARKDSSHRSVVAAVTNQLGQQLTLVESVLKSGKWTTKPPEVLNPNAVAIFEAESGPGLTADLHGSFTYSWGNQKLSIHFVNLFLAEKTYFSDTEDTLVVVTPVGEVSQEHARVVYAIMKPNKVPLMESPLQNGGEELMEVEAANEPEEGSSSKLQPPAEHSTNAEAGAPTEGDPDILTQLTLLGFDEATARDALNKSNGDMVAAVDLLLQSK